MDRRYYLIIISMCGLAGASIGICINSVGVFYTCVSESLGVLKGTFALHATLFTFTSAIISMFVNKVIDENNLKLLMIIGILLSVFTTALMGYSRLMWQFYLLAIIKGVGVAFFGMVVISNIINNWFISKHGIITSVVFSFSGIIGALCSPLLGFINETYGWEIGYLMMALLILLLCLPAIVTQFTLNPEKMGYKGYFTGCKQIQNKDETTKENSKNHYVLIIVFAFMVTFVTGLSQHFPGYATSIGISSSIGALMISCCMIGNIVSKLIIGVLSEFLGILKSVLLMMLVSLISMTIMMVSTNSIVLIISSFFFGFIFSITAVGLVLIVKKSYGVDNYGNVYPIISLASNIGSAASLSLIGYIYDAFATYMPAFIVLCGIILLNIGILYIIEK